MSRDIDVILLDVGGVLVELGPSPVPVEVLPDGSDFDQRRWFESHTSVAFHTGRIDAEDFAEATLEELGLDCGKQEFIDHFTAWPRGLFAGVPELLESLRDEYRLAILTNTNALHWPRFIDEFDLSRRVDTIFASHQLGLAKPDTAIFRQVCARLDVAPRSILFLDDGAENVGAAAALGFRSSLVEGFDGLVETLRIHGVR